MAAAIERMRVTEDGPAVARTGFHVGFENAGGTGNGDVLAHAEHDARSWVG